MAAIWREHGLPVVDADVLARAAVAKGSRALSAILAEFGQEYLGPDGELDRRRLAERIFGDTAATARLNAIVHPEVRRLSQLKFAELAQTDHPLACYEVPLLFENGLESTLRPVVVVNCSSTEQLKRAMARDGSPASSVARRLQAQWPLAEKVARADVVIDNNGIPSELRALALRALGEVCRKVECDATRYQLV